MVTRQPSKLKMTVRFCYVASYADVAEPADATDLGSVGRPCEFESHLPYCIGENVYYEKSIRCIKLFADMAD